MTSNQKKTYTFPNCEQHYWYTHNSYLISFYMENFHKIDTKLFDIDCGLCDGCYDCIDIKEHLYELIKYEMFDDPEGEEDDTDDEYQDPEEQNKMDFRVDLHFARVTDAISDEILTRLTLKKNMNEVMPYINAGENYIAAICVRNYLNNN